VDSSVEDSALLILIETWIDEEHEPIHRYAGILSCT
jgi:hypothetical protein